MLLKSVSRRVSKYCFTASDRKITSICLLILCSTLLILIPGKSFSQENEEEKQIKAQRQKSAISFFKEEKGDEIIDLLSKNLTSLSFKELVILSEAYKWNEDNLKRAQVLEYAKNIYPNKVSVQIELGRTYLNEALSFAPTDNFKAIRNQNIEKARTLFSTAVKEYPSLSSYKAYIDFLEKTPNSPDEVIQVIKEGSINIGKSPYFLSKLCHWHYEAGYIKSGIKSCNTAIEAKPNDSESHLTLAKLLADSGNKKGSRDSLLKTASRFPASANAQYFAAQILHDEGKIMESLKHLDKAIENNPPDEALVLRAKLLFNLNKLDDALEAYTLACKNHKEPRKPLIKSLKRNFHKVDEKDPLKSKYESALYKCKYVYRPERKKPKGFVSSKK